MFLFEDADVIVKLLWKSRTIALCDTAKYHYVVGMDSLSNGKTNLRRIESTILFWNDFVEQVRRYYPSQVDKASCKRDVIFYQALIQMFRVSIVHADVERQLLQYIKRRGCSLVKEQKSFKHKLLNLLLLFYPKGAKLLIKI